VLLSNWFEVADGIGETFFETGHECQAGCCFTDMLFSCSDVDWAALITFVVVVVVVLVVVVMVVRIWIVVVVEEGRSAFGSTLLIVGRG